nr:hypothetical protein [Prevotella sp.]
MKASFHCARLHFLCIRKVALGNLKASFHCARLHHKHLNYIIMLGINAPKVLAKGKYAQAVRKAALASIGAKAKTDDATKTPNYPYKFEWNLE